MKAVVFHDVGDIRLDDVPEPTLGKPDDAIVSITASAICGTDLHLVRGTLPGMRKGTILGHEGIGIVEEVGKQVRNLKAGDRVVIPSSIACGVCAYCRAACYSQCDCANPNGSDAGTAFFGGPEESGPFDGLQAETARIPFANTGLVKLPDEIADDDAIMLSDIFPTGYFGAELAEIEPGNTVAVFGCGPVGQFAIASARLFGAGRIFAVDSVAGRLEMAQSQGAEAIDFNREDPVDAIRELTHGIGVDRAIDAVGVDAEAPRRNGKATHRLWQPGSAPSQALTWAVDALAKAGTLSIVGVYSEKSRTFPVGDAAEKNLTIKMGNCNHRRYLPLLIELVRTGAIVPRDVLTETEPLTNAIEAYEAFDLRNPGWVKVKLEPASERFR